MKYKRVVVTRYGGADSLQIIEEERPEPKNNEVRRKHREPEFQQRGAAHHGDHEIGGGDRQGQSEDKGCAGDQADGEKHALSRKVH